MADLKRYRHGARNGVMTPDPDGSFVRYDEAAAALEAAREDAERYQWLRVNEQDRSDVFLACSFDDLDAAIDQARGIVPEAGQRVGK